MAKLTPEGIARLVVRKKQLALELDSVREEIKKAVRESGIDLPFAVDVDGYAVMVKRPQYAGGMPQADVVPLLGIGQ